MNTNTYERQRAVGAAARASGHPVLDGGRGQPNWTVTDPRAGFFRLGAFAVDATAASSALDTTDPYWGTAPSAEGLAERLATELADDPSPGARFLAAAVLWAQDELGFDGDAWVAELVRGVLGAGYPSPNRILRHVERVLEAYLVDITGTEPGPPGRFRVFATEGGAAAMAYIFRTLQENRLLRRGDRIAIATPIFTPYLEIPLLADFGFDVVELRSAHYADHRFDERTLDALRDPTIKAFFVVNPGNPDSRAMRTERLAQLRDLVLRDRPDLLVIADTAYATFVDGFRSTLAELPRNVILVHSFSKNFGATGNRLGFVAVADDTVADELLAAQDEADQEAARRRYGCMTSDVAALPFVARLVADSREVALHNITGLATPDQVQMALFALAHLMPDGAAHRAAVRAELTARQHALLAPLGVDPPGGADAQYYALVDLVRVVTARHGPDAMTALADRTDPADVPMLLARDHGVVVMPGAGFGGVGWDVRVCLAALSIDELAAVGSAIASLVDQLIDDTPGRALAQR
ncbi:MAG: bifunctional aspartate transaminase/aspartate 4-decarboxylase [Pseudonocardia sp.]